MKPPKEKKVQSKIGIIIFNVIIFFVCMVLGGHLISTSYEYQDVQKSYYEEKSNLDYKVYLNDNKFYENDYLDKDMLYVANLIDKIKINFDYNYKIDSKQNIDFVYNIFGKLVISDNAGKKVYLEKNYKLLKDKELKLSNETQKSIKEDISIDYEYYNSLANDFKSSYGVDTDSKLIVYMTITKKNADSTIPNFSDMSTMLVNIPLSKKSVEIALDYDEINNSNFIISKDSKSNFKIFNIILSCLLILFAIIDFIKTMRLISSKSSKYDKYIKKLLREFDRLIVESSNKISFDDKETINLDKFTELIDVHDNLQLPILYYKTNLNTKCNFYIVHENIVYLHTIKASDFED